MIALLNRHDKAPIVHLVGDMNGVANALVAVLNEAQGLSFSGIGIGNSAIHEWSGREAPTHAYLLDPQEVEHAIRLARSQNQLLVFVDPHRTMDDQLEGYVQMLVEMETETVGTVVMS